MNDFKVPANEIYRRNFNLQKHMQANGIDGLFVVQRVDLFYFFHAQPKTAFFIYRLKDNRFYALKDICRAQNRNPL